MTSNKNAKVIPPADFIENIQNIYLEDEMSKSYRSYAMSVIISRALPDVRDGLKPVHRRILYTMYESGYRPGAPYRKCARVVGDVMGKYHPHGDAAIYEAMVRMGQDFSMRVPLIDGQGNYGSIDGDPPAAMRYTEARTARISDEALTADIKLDTVDFKKNYDETEMEPAVLPSKYPNLLVNGSQGIAVAFATNMAPHNLGEVVDATVAYIDNPDINLIEIMNYIKGPDYPTGGIIKGNQGILQAYKTGSGRVVTSSVYEIEKLRGDREQIVFTQIPYMVNKENLVIKIGELMKLNDKKERVLEEVSVVRDESSREGIRVVLELKKDANPELVLNKLRKNTDVVSSFSINATCLNPSGKQEVMSLLQIIGYFVTFRRQVIHRRTEYLLTKSRADLNRQIALFAAGTQIDRVVSIIRGSDTTENAKDGLMSMEFPVVGELKTFLSEIDPDEDLPNVFRFSEEQAKSILALRLTALTKIEGTNIAQEARVLLGTIKEYEGILNNPERVNDIMKSEMIEIRNKYATPRLTKIEENDLDSLEEDELVEQKPVVLTLTKSGYIKTTALDAYREQYRGGKGRGGMDNKENDPIIKTFTCMTRSLLLFFTTRGIVHAIKTYKLPETAINAKGRPIVNFIPMKPGETIATVMEIKEVDLENQYFLFVTNKGEVRRNSALDFKNINKGGKIAMKLEDDNGNQSSKLLDVLIAKDTDALILASKLGKGVRFSVSDLRVFQSRASTGVKGINLSSKDELVSATLVPNIDLSLHEREAYFNGGTYKFLDENKEEKKLVLTKEQMVTIKENERFLLTVSEKGYGKRFSSHEIKTTARGAQGVIIGNFGDKWGPLIACQEVEDSDGIVIMTKNGQTIRTRVEEIRMTTKNGKGVKLFVVPEDDKIADFTITKSVE
jgi:DNA gyrase subunit A